MGRGGDRFTFPSRGTGQGQKLFPLAEGCPYREGTTSSSKSGPLTPCLVASLRILFLRGLG